MKVALCLTGLIGSLQGKSWNKSGGTQTVLDTCFTHNKKHILDKNDVDVFFHTWDVDYKNQLIDKYKPKRYQAQKQKVFDEIIPPNSVRVQAHYSKWYSIKECVKMKQNYELQKGFTYDFVLQSRFDLVWTTDVIFSNFDTDKFYIPRTSKYGKPWGWPHKINNHEIGDLFYFSNSHNMNKFSELYYSINPYLLNGCPTFEGISNHMLAKWHLNELGLLENNVELAFDDMKGDFVIVRKYL